MAENWLKKNRRIRRDDLRDLDRFGRAVIATFLSARAATFLPGRTAFPSGRAAFRHLLYLSPPGGSLHAAHRRILGRQLVVPIVQDLEVLVGHACRTCKKSKSGG